MGQYRLGDTEWAEEVSRDKGEAGQGRNSWKGARRGRGEIGKQWVHVSEDKHTVLPKMVRKLFGRQSEGFFWRGEGGY